MNWLLPWTEVPEAVARPMEGLHPDHPLAGHPVRRAARRWDCDEVLFEVLSERPFWAVVHLTWQDESQSPASPTVELYDTLTDFSERRMLPDHHYYQAANP
jgi:hypothetical protein